MLKYSLAWNAVRDLCDSLLCVVRSYKAAPSLFHKISIDVRVLNIDGYLMKSLVQKKLAHAVHLRSLLKKGHLIPDD